MLIILVLILLLLVLILLLLVRILLLLVITGTMGRRRMGRRRRRLLHGRLWTSAGWNALRSEGRTRRRPREPLICRNCGLLDLGRWFLGEMYRCLLMCHNCGLLDLIGGYLLGRWWLSLRSDSR